MANNKSKNESQETVKGKCQSKITHPAKKMYVCVYTHESEVAQSCPTLSDPMDCSPPGSSILGDFPGKSTGVGCHCLVSFILSNLTYILEIQKKHQLLLYQSHQSL